MRSRDPGRTCTVALLAALLVSATAAGLPPAAAAELAPANAPKPRLQTLRFGEVPRLADLGAVDVDGGAIDPRTDLTEIRGRFLHRHLMPRLGQQLEKLGPLDEQRIAGRWFEDLAYTEQLGERTRDVAESAAGKAVQYFLLEETTLSRVVESLEAAADRVETRASSAIARPGGGFRLDLAIAHGAPQLRIRRGLKNGSLRLSLGSYGDVGVRLHHARFGRHARVVARFDPVREHYGVSCSFDF